MNAIENATPKGSVKTTRVLRGHECFGGAKPEEALYRRLHAGHRLRQEEPGTPAALKLGALHLHRIPPILDQKFSQKSQPSHAASLESSCKLL